jgi:hypothetical protein
MRAANPQVKLSRKLNIALTPKAFKYMATSGSTARKSTSRPVLLNPVPPCLERTEPGLSVRLVSVPIREEVKVLCEFSKVIEYYAR